MENQTESLANKFETFSLDPAIEAHVQSYDDIIAGQAAEIDRLRAQKLRLEKAMVAMHKEITLLKEKNSVLSTNICSLFYTAQMEIERCRSQRETAASRFLGSKPASSPNTPEVRRKRS